MSAKRIQKENTTGTVYKWLSGKTFNEMWQILDFDSPKSDRTNCTNYFWHINHIFNSSNYFSMKFWNFIRCSLIQVIYPIFTFLVGYEITKNVSLQSVIDKWSSTSRIGHARVDVFNKEAKSLANSSTFIEFYFKQMLNKLRGIAETSLFSSLLRKSLVSCCHVYGFHPCLLVTCIRKLCDCVIRHRHGLMNVTVLSKKSWQCDGSQDVSDDGMWTPAATDSCSVVTVSHIWSCVILMCHLLPISFVL